MSRKGNFFPKPVEPKAYKSLRTHGREAAEYLTGLKYLPDPAPKAAFLHKPGRGASGEHNN